MEPAGMNAIFRHFVHSKRRTRLSRGSVIKMMNFIGAAQAAQIGGRGLFPPAGEVSGSFMFFIILAIVQIYGPSLELWPESLITTRGPAQTSMALSVKAASAAMMAARSSG